MAEQTAVVELTKLELQALGMVIALWRADFQGLNSLPAVVMLLAAATEMDDEVLLALLDRAVLKLSQAEDMWDGLGPFRNEDERDEARARMLSRLDQDFARFRSEGRSLFPQRDDDEDA